MRRTIGERLAAVLTAICAAIVVVAVAILPFLTPGWVAFEQGRTGAARLAGYSDTELAVATTAILHDLVLGPPDFTVEVAAAPVLEERERAHMRDVRVVFAEFYALALVAAVGVVVLVAGARVSGHRERAWRAIATGMRWLIVAIVVAGVVVTFFFDAAFELFHRLFFPGGSYTFDPRTDRLVQLFPFDFWSETTLAVGALILVIAAVTWFASSRASRASRASRRDAADVASGTTSTTGTGRAESSGTAS